MSSNSRKASLVPWILSLVLILGSALPANAFWGSGNRRRIEEADRLMDTARQAEEGQRIMDACEAYSQAHELYRKVQTDSPDTRPEYLEKQAAECRARLRTLFARASTGEVATPAPEEIMPSLRPSPTPSEAISEEPAPTPEPESVPTPAMEEEPPAAKPQSVRKASSRTSSRTWLGRQFSRKEAPDAAAAGPGDNGQDAARQPDMDPEVGVPPDRKTPEPTSTDASPEVREVPAPDRRASPSPALSDTALSRKIQEMLDHGAGADAVILLEELVERAGDSATLTQRLLFVQALLNRRNYTRAASELEALQLAHPDNPSVRMMAAGLAMAQGRPIASLKYLDELVREYPRFADAYINLAYTRFAMDPVANRDEAILYYRHALALGASRDPRLEQELRVDVE